eukprot:Opistho-2@26763
METPVKTVPSASARRAFGWTGSTEFSRVGAATSLRRRQVPRRLRTRLAPGHGRAETDQETWGEKPGRAGFAPVAGKPRNYSPAAPRDARSVGARGGTGVQADRRRRSHVERLLAARLCNAHERTCTRHQRLAHALPMYSALI